MGDFTCLSHCTIHLAKESNKRSDFNRHGGPEVAPQSRKRLHVLAAGGIHLAKHPVLWQLWSVGSPFYPLVMTNIAIENDHRNSGFMVI
jgi:NADH:ubiquinone oxidoreductase subunit B-like Fe-S oxidoreductase